jgi:DNA repair protein RadC
MRAAVPAPGVVMSIAQWPLAERPREKMLARGASALSDAELLAIFLRTGSRGRNAVDLGRELLMRSGDSLTRLLATPFGTLRQIPGLGQAKFVQFQAAQTCAYPREIVRAALEVNAAVVIVAHNHPSGIALPSPADVTLTRLLGDALALLEIRLLDHYIVAGDSVYSLAEQGEL